MRNLFGQGCRLRGMRGAWAALASCLLLTLLAGCSNGTGGQEASSDGALAYNGASAGEQTTTRQCPARATLHWSANLGSGSLALKVTDSSGATVWSRTVTGPGQAADQTGLSAATGTWTVKATRSSGFAGQYALHLEC
jgi:hypothetical protein